MNKDLVNELTAAEEKIDNQAFLKVKDLILTLANTISALKIFPKHHASAVHFRKEFINKLKSFLDEYQQLELEISEFAFFYKGKQVYQDEISSKSLPFFFYKDGLRILAFYQGMSEEEIQDFLELVRTESAKPAEESDIVNALWLKDLPNIQYYAPEEFLENRILEERSETLARKGLKIIPQELSNRVINIQVDRKQLFNGQVELQPEDREALSSFQPEDQFQIPENWQQPFEFSGGEVLKEAMQAASPEEKGTLPAVEASSLFLEVKLDQKDLEQLNQLIEKNRQLSPEEEFINLMVEILALKEDLQQFRLNLETLHDFYVENIKNGHFVVPVLISDKLKKFKELITSGRQDKKQLIDEFLEKTTDLKILDEIAHLVETRAELNLEALFNYLVQFGDKAITFMADLYEKIEDEEFRGRLKEFLAEKIKLSPQMIVQLADDQRPKLTELIIELMRQQPAQKIIPSFSHFLTFSNRDLKLKAVEALASFNDELASRLLFGFLNDSDPEVRIKATSSIKFLSDTTRLNQLMKEVFTGKFRKKSLEEKKALFEFLGRTRQPEAFAFLKKIFLKKSPWPHVTELRICAAAGLAAMHTKEAINLLRRGENFFNRKVRQAAVEALAALGSQNPQER
ncbi:MAG: HEAT repeat domain-containing protein [Candidatus Aminicenantes bacterium]|nr:HEAT repeat domain-containing protein [Candidatus Aminicenantes bacterium]